MIVKNTGYQESQNKRNVGRGAARRNSLRVKYRLEYIKDRNRFNF